MKDDSIIPSTEERVLRKKLKCVCLWQVKGQIKTCLRFLGRLIEIVPNRVRGVKNLTNQKPGVMKLTNQKLGVMKLTNQKSGVIKSTDQKI